MSKLQGCNKEVYSTRLSVAIRARVRLELVRVKRHFPACTDNIRQSEAAVANILPGKHQNCKKLSLVCTAHLDSYSTSFLPYGKHIQLNYIDMLHLRGVLQKNSHANLEKMSQLSTTNRSERLHHKVFTYAPKCTIWSRNFTGLCNSAVHLTTLGSRKSSIFIATSIGFKYKKTDPIFRRILKLDSSVMYHSKRKQSKQYKILAVFQGNANAAKRKMRELSVC